MLVFINKNMDIDKLLEKRKHVYEFYKDNIPSKHLIDSLLKRTWKVTPSKNQFMAYNVNVIAPEHTNYKKQIYNLCTFYEKDINKQNSISDVSDLNANLLCLLTAPYILIFTNRFEDSPNKEQLDQHNKGVYYEALDKNNFEELYDTNSLEVGMFSKTLTALCLQNNLDVSYTKCFPFSVQKWKEVLPFIQTRPILVMSIGKGKTFKLPKLVNNEITDLRPEYKKIVKWIF